MADVGREGATPDTEALIEQLRARAADPNGRTDYRPSMFEAGIRAMSLGGMRSLGKSLMQDLGRVVKTNQAGQMPDEDAMNRATRLESDMTTPAPAGSLRKASEADLSAAEAALGVAFPPFLARLYLEIADGGFGPGGGLLSLDGVVRETRELRSGAQLARGRTWPPSYLPLVHLDPGWTCVDVSTGAVVDWDPEDMTERMSEERFRTTFSERSPSVNAWLAKWLRKRAAADRKPSQDERWARMAARAQSPAGMAAQERKTRGHLAQLSREDRAKWGFDTLYPEIEAELRAAEDLER